MHRLSLAFTNYLRSERSHANAMDLVHCLADFGLVLESQLLAAHVEGKTSVSVLNDWTAKAIVLGSLPPEKPQTGDCWFDPLECVLATFVPHLEDQDPRSGGWYSSKPVQVWQYLGFLNAMNFLQVERSEAILFQKNSFDQRDPISVATSIYSFEAIAYGMFFGKTMVGDLIQNAKLVLPPNLLQRLIPSGLRIWDESTAWGREDLPLAFCLETSAYEDIFDQLDRTFEEEKRIIHQQWERSAGIGFVTYAESTGLLYSKDGLIYPFIQIQNVPKR